MPYTPPVKRIELSVADLTVCILNTGNLETGNLTLALSGVNADAFTLPATTIRSLAIGSKAYITLSLRSNLAIGTYTAILTVSGEGLAPQTLTITHTVTTTGIESPQAVQLQALSTAGGLQINGLVPGEIFSIYNILGQLHFKGKATATEQTVQLYERGIYIVVSGARRVKTVH